MVLGRKDNARRSGWSTLICLSFVSCVLAQTRQPLARYPLREVSSPTRAQAAEGTVAGPSIFDRLEVNVLFPADQNARFGLQFTLEVSNSSDQKVVIYDPTDVMQINLSDQAGLPIALRGVPSLLEINTKSPRETHMELDKDRPFIVQNLPERNIPANVKTIDDLDEERYVELDPGERFWVPAVIKRVIASPKEYLRASEEHSRQHPQAAPLKPEIASIKNGSYKIRASLPLIVKGKPGHTLQSDEISVELE